MTSAANLFASPTPIEGFNELLPNATPSAVELNANAVFAFYSEDDNEMRIGSASLIKVTNKELVTELFFLTNEHVVRKDCPTDGPCKGINLFQQANIKKSSLFGSKLLSSKGFTGAEYEVIKRSLNPDLAIIKMIVPLDNTISIPKPVKISPSCSNPTQRKVYTIGFSGTDLRTAAGSKPIPFNDYQHKRWSEGIEVSYHKEILENQEGRYLSTTVDILPGGSGGPLLNEKGEMIGVMTATGSGRSNGYKYFGNEDPKNLDWTSLAVTCDLLREFILSANMEINSQEDCR